METYEEHVFNCLEEAKELLERASRTPSPLSANHMRILALQELFEVVEVLNDNVRKEAHGTQESATQVGRRV